MGPQYKQPTPGSSASQDGHGFLVSCYTGTCDRGAPPRSASLYIAYYVSTFKYKLILTKLFPRAELCAALAHSLAQQVQGSSCRLHALLHYLHSQVQGGICLAFRRAAVPAQQSGYDQTGAVHCWPTDRVPEARGGCRLTAEEYLSQLGGLSQQRLHYLDAIFCKIVQIHKEMLTSH